MAPTTIPSHSKKTKPLLSDDRRPVSEWFGYAGSVSRIHRADWTLGSSGEASAVVYLIEDDYLVLFKGEGPTQHALDDSLDDSHSFSSVRHVE